MADEQVQAAVDGEINRAIKVSWEDVKNSASKASVEEKPEVKESPEPATPEAVEAPKPEVDYEKELARFKEKAEREKSLREYERSERKRLERELEKQSSKTEETVETEAETPDLDRIVEEKLEKLRFQEREDVIEDILSDLSDNQHEKELVRTIYENRLRPSGWSKKAIREDLEQAMLIANRSRLETIAFTKAKEKVRQQFAQNKAMQESASTGGSVGRKPPESLPSYNSIEEKWLSRVGKKKADGD